MNKLSIVLTARNDNYGAHQLNRLQSAIKVLIHLANILGSPMELIIVEYNPPSDHNRLREVLSFTGNGYISIRFIEVPSSYHAKLPNAAKIALFEFIAKNIGVRRASGDYILSTNQDILFSEDMLRYLVSTKLDPKAFYRVNRHDIATTHFDPDADAETILAVARKTEYCYWTPTGKVSIGISLNSVYSILKDYAYKLYVMVFKNGKGGAIRSGQQLHEAAAGDFFMMHRNGWANIRGFDEVPLSNFIDGYALHVARCRGYRQLTIPSPIYHMDHGFAKRGRPSVDLAEYRTACNRMLETGKPYKTNAPDWGARGVKFPEFSVSPETR